MQPGFRVWSRQPENREGRAEEIQALNDTKDIFDRFCDQNHRVIGHVFYSPPRALHPDGWLRDWALVELDAKKFGKDLTNMVYIGTVDQSIQDDIQSICPPFQWKNMSLKLEDSVPEDDMKNPKMTDLNDEPCLIVAKRVPLLG